jgi:hypothetical protein
MERENDMTDTLTVEIPADVKDNSRTAVRVQWRSVRPVKLVEIEQDKGYAHLYGYTVHEWDDEDRDGNRVTLTRFINRSGITVNLYATYYFTRVACTDCEHSYATRYIAVTDADGDTHPAAPFCDEHGHVVKRITDRQPGWSWAESAELSIGQHD